MSSGSVQHLVTDDHIHVGKDPRSKTWWAVGKGGSYGGGLSRAAVVRIAVGAALTLHCDVVLHDSHGRVVGRRTPTGTPESQFFQDSVE